MAVPPLLFPVWIFLHVSVRKSRRTPQSLFPHENTLYHSANFLGHRAPLLLPRWIFRRWYFYKRWRNAGDSRKRQPSETGFQYANWSASLAESIKSEL